MVNLELYAITPQDWLALEGALRLTVFVGLFAALALSESAFPKRPLLRDRYRRWGHNLLLMMSGSVAVNLFLPMLAAGTAWYAQLQGFGLFQALHWPFWVELVLTLMLMDLLIYWQHRLFHKIPLLWRLHRTHHGDEDLDVSTAVRFHPIEILLSMVVKCLFVLIMGPSVVAVILFEVLLNGSALFTHSNIQLPKWIDGGLRKVCVTPDMHRVHHSTLPSETDSNFGFFLSIWDRLFGSYVAAPQAGDLGVTIGLTYIQGKRAWHIGALLAEPFVRKK